MDEIILQIIVWTSFFLLSVMGTRYYFKKNSTYNLGQTENKQLDERILIILPFRNEESIIERALQKVISEIISNVNCKLVLVDSASDDKSVDVVQKTIAESPLTADMWALIHEDFPERNSPKQAINSYYIEGDIVVMVDADIEIPNGTLQTFRELMSNSNVGAISAQEYILPNHPMASYKKRSNKLRIFESSSGNCPILEGSLLAWSPLRIGWNSF